MFSSVPVSECDMRRSLVRHSAKTAATIGLVFTSACALQHHSAKMSPTPLMAPPVERFMVVVSAESAVFAIPVPRIHEWQWNVTTTSERPGTEYGFEVQWDARGASIMRAGYSDGIAVQLNTTGQPARGALADLVAASQPMAIAQDGQRRQLLAGAEPALHADADSADHVVLVLSASDRLTRLLRSRPDSVYVTVILAPLHQGFSRMVPVRYRTTAR
jgi:hypothetical protein